MVKIKTISRSEDQMTRERPIEVNKVHKNLDPTYHPFERAREYTRALNAAKLDRIFAKPFIGALEGHRDGVFCLMRHPTSISTVYSGSCDGEIRIWNLSFKTTVWNVRAHTGFVRGMTFGEKENTFLSCGDDNIVKLWTTELHRTIVGREKVEEDYLAVENLMKESKMEDDGDKKPIATWYGKHRFLGIDHKRNSSLFCTCGVDVQLWDENRSALLNTFGWGADSITSLRFNPVETDIFASTATDRSIVIYDLRGKTPVRKVILDMKTNAVAWNPMHTFDFTAANEDHNLYTFDMRKMNQAKVVHKDHVSAVLDVDYSPTGKELCSGSYDRSIRIFGSDSGKSREVYHTKRMQRIFAVKFSGDAKYVLSGSDDTNIRIWKAVASEQLGILLPRQRAAIDYSARVKNRFKYAPDVKRIDRFRHAPKAIHKAKQLKQVLLGKAQRKHQNRLKNSRKGTVTVVPEKKKHIVAELE